MAKYSLKTKLDA
ncbi:Protein of unknown function [Bacillus cereus]|nr:Protein of unknown function [Bacillus cereus]SCN41751.1 Protein of unknown function [Bacillus wiedmannii]